MECFASKGMSGMKKILYLLLLILGVAACSKEDLTPYQDQLNQLTNSNDSLSRANNDQNIINDALKEEAARIQRRLDSLANAGKTPDAVELVAMEFSAAENPQLSEDLKCTIGRDGAVECWIPKIVDNKTLIPRFSFHGSEVTINDQKATTGTSAYDFTCPVTMKVSGSGKTVKYTIIVHSFTGLPVMYIDTQGGKKIESKDYYLRAHMKFVEDAKTRGPGDVMEADLQIKGRGNSTWGLPKKPYRLKFDDKISFFGEHKDRSWVLLANYTDKSMIRNDLALFIGRMSRLNWTSSSHFVELVLNGEYQGTYELCEKIKVSNHRVAVGDDGFLMRVEARADKDSTATWFYVPYIAYSVELLEPEVSFGHPDYHYVHNYLIDAANTLFSPNFRDPDSGWQKYMDMESFVDWYLIHEISKNEDSMFHFSTYMNLKRGGKLKMGPIWDFDIAFGNVKEDATTAMYPEGLMLDWSVWYQRLMEDPAFVAKLKERYKYFYSHKMDFMYEVDMDAQYLRNSAFENQKKWGNLYHYTYKQWDIWGAYQNEAQALKDWLDRRMEWLQKQFDRM